MSVIRDPYTLQGGKINSDGQQIGEVETHAEARVHAEQGKAFWLATGFIPLTTTGSFNAVFYLKNTSETKNIHIGKFRTCSNQICEWKLAHTITAGTLFTDQTAATQMNLRVGATTTLTANIYKGADGKTMVGTEVPTWINNIGHSQPDFAGSLILGPTSSIGIAVKPAAAGDICLTVECWQTLPE
jgi:hypothetical protein